MSTKRQRNYRGTNWELEMTQDWLVDAFVGLFALVWLLLTFATIQQHPDKIVPLLGGALLIAFTSILLINGHRLNYLRIGDRVLADMQQERQRLGENDETEWEEYR